MTTNDDRDLARYRAAMEDLRERLPLNPEEVLLIAQATAVVDFRPEAIAEFPSVVRAGMHAGSLDAQYGVDAFGLLSTLELLSLADYTAIVDALERAAAMPDQDPATLPARLAAVGLIHADDVYTPAGGDV